MAVAVENVVRSTSGGFGSYSNSGTGRIVVLLISMCSDSPPSVSAVSGGGLTWARRSQFFNTESGGPTQTQEVWWAYAAAQVSAASITITESSASFINTRVAIILSVSGVTSTSAPWDANVAVPANATRNGTATIPGVAGVSWNSTDGVVISHQTTRNPVFTQAAPTGFTQSGPENNEPGAGDRRTYTVGGYKIVSATGSAQSFADGASSTAGLWLFTADVMGNSGSPDGNASGVILTVAASVLSGSAAISGTASGSTLSVPASLLSGAAGVSGTAPGATLTANVSMISGAASTKAIDGTAIYETTFGIARINAYQESDYDSMFSRGRRNQNGLITSGQYGWSTIFSQASDGFDNNLGAAGGNGPAYGGTARAAVWIHSADFLDIRGLRFVGSSQFIAGEQGTWEFKGAFGIGSTNPNSYAIEFDAMLPQSGPSFLAGTSPANNVYSTEFLMTPRTSVLYDWFEMGFIGGTRTSVRLCQELEFKISHSNLDGGDRRSTNGRPEKRCVFTMSASWVFSNVLIDPQDALFDGRHLYENAGDATKSGHQAAIGKTPSGNPMDVAGEWLQFVFPRPVIMKRLMFVTFNTSGEAYVSNLPTIFGTWHWEISKNSGTTWSQVGTSWSFSVGGDMVAPRNLGEFDIDRSNLGVGADGVSHWRMVLESGPAFGIAEVLDQVTFDLYDVTGLAPSLTVDFTDDADGVPIVFTLGNPGSPYQVAFSDDSDDKLTLEVQNTPNPVLTVAFDDGAAFDTWSDLYPSIVVQTSVVTTGR